MVRLMIMTGGTGGHVIPALAVARCLRNRGVDVCWMGTTRGIESSLVPAEGFSFHPIHILGLRGKGLQRKLVLPFLLFWACVQAFRVLLRKKPDVLLGMGGYVSAPGGLMAGLLRKPLVLHEQNAVAGLTNRWLARLATRVLTGFPEVEGLPSGDWVGNPVRSDICSVDPPSTRLQQRRGPLRILVVGGSQGARVFNRRLPELLSRRPGLSLTVRHQTGSGEDVNGVWTDYQERRISAEVVEFITDMASAYAWSDVVICRAGAMTLAEICAAGCVAFLVPYPHAVSDHQTRNAHYLIREGAAFLVPQGELSNGHWLEELEELAADRERLVEIAERARALARTDSAERVADICGELAHA